MSYSECRIKRNDSQAMNRLILKRLTVEDFGPVRRFAAVFDPKLAVLPKQGSETVIQAIGIVTGNRSLAGNVPEWMITDGTRIAAELVIGERTYRITARKRPDSVNTEGCPAEGDLALEATEAGKPVDAAGLFGSTRLFSEEERLTRYRFDPDDLFEARLLRYRDPEEFFPDPAEYAYGIKRRTFRLCLADHLKRMRKENGRPSEHGSPKRKDFLACLDVIAFWDEFEEIRDLNYVRRPLIIDSKTVAAELLRGGGLRERCEKLGRQLILKL